MYRKLCVLALFCALAQLPQGMMLGGFRSVNLEPREMKQLEKVVEQLSAQYSMENMKLECAERQVPFDIFTYLMRTLM